MHRLYVVNVPAGHTQDMTLRARRVLREAALVVAEASAAMEDAGWLRFPGETPVLVREGRDDGEVARIVLEALRLGDVAWVSASDGPALEGQGVLSALLAEGVEVLPVPGPWALIACLVVSGLPADRFTSMGVLPAASPGCRAAFQAAVDEPQTLIWRLPAEGATVVLHEAQAVLGPRRCVVCAPGEEGVVWRGRLGEMPAHAVGGGYLVVEGCSAPPVWPAERVRDRVCEMLARGVSVRDTARAIADLSGWRRKAVYRVAVERRAALDEGVGGNSVST